MEPRPHRRTPEPLPSSAERNLGRMIHDNVSPAKPSARLPDRPQSSLGQLEKLPTEMLVLVLHQLDFQTLSRALRVCSRIKTMVELVRPYQQVMQHAPKLLTALAKTNLIGRYPASRILQALETSRCASCSEFGAFLYLPTMDKVCFECLYQNRSFWVIPRAQTKKYFGLTKRQVGRLPAMRSIHGTYVVGGPERTHKRNYQLVSVGHAKQLGLDVHGSPEELAKLIPSTPTPRTSEAKLNEYFRFKHYQEAPLEPPGRATSLDPEETPYGNDRFAGMATLRVPHLTASGADWGHLCIGCLTLYRQFIDRTMPLPLVYEFSLSELPSKGHIYALVTRLYSHAGLLEHTKTCCGMRQLLAAERLPQRS